MKPIFKAIRALQSAEGKKLNRAQIFQRETFASKDLLAMVLLDGYRQGLFLREKDEVGNFVYCINPDATLPEEPVEPPPVPKPVTDLPSILAELKHSKALIEGAINSIEKLAEAA